MDESEYGHLYLTDTGQKVLDKLLVEWENALLPLALQASVEQQQEQHQGVEHVAE